MRLEYGTGILDGKWTGWAQIQYKDTEESSMIHTATFPTTRQEVPGGYLIKDVPLIVEGTWNGCVYSARELQDSAYSWRDNSVWDRHFEGRQRDESNRVGIISNQRYENGAILGDVLLSNKTPEGRDIIHFVQSNQLNGISVEHVGTYKQNGSSVIASEISFMGAAVVPTPACTVCQLSKKELAMEQKEFDKLNDTVAELAKSVKELTKVDVETIVKEQSAKDLKTIAELEARIKKIEKTPVPGTESGVSNLVDGYAGIVVENGESKRSDE